VIGCGVNSPALLTSTSIAPKAVATSSTIAAAARESVMSAPAMMWPSPASEVRTPSAAVRRAR